MANASATPADLLDDDAPVVDAAHDASAGPIRGELLGADQLAERARKVAKQERLRPGRRLG